MREIPSRRTSRRDARCSDMRAAGYPESGSDFAEHVCSSATEKSPERGTTSSPSLISRNSMSQQFHLTQYGLMAERHWREFQPTMVQRLKLGRLPSTSRLRPPLICSHRDVGGHRMSADDSLAAATFRQDTLRHHAAAFSSLSERTDLGRTLHRRQRNLLRDAVENGQALRPPRTTSSCFKFGRTMWPSHWSCPGSPCPPKHS